MNAGPPALMRCGSAAAEDLAVGHARTFGATGADAFFRAEWSDPMKEPSMLVLSRTRDETIMIGDDVEITVVDIRGDKVRLGVNAPMSVSVHRKEVYEAIRRENLESAQLRPDSFVNVVARRRSAHA
jgi:carbon storage regulator